jgi:hypothetical protein
VAEHMNAETSKEPKRIWFEPSLSSPITDVVAQSYFLPLAPLSHFG